MLRILFFLFFCSTVLAQNTEYEHIISYHSDLHIQKNTEVIITEKIKVYATGNEIRRGIFRDLPLSYEYKGGNVHVDFELISILKDGQLEQYHTEWLDNGIRIYIGKEDVYLNPGYYTYTIKYKVGHVLGYFKKYDELYWNINGNGWGFRIDTISAHIYPPNGAKIVQFDGYTGAFGEAYKDFVTKKFENRIEYGSTEPLNYRENLTVAVAWEKGFIKYPTPMDEFLFWLRTYILWVIALLGFVIGLLYNLIAWFRFGRDPKPGTIIPRFYAPEGMSPAECAYLKKAGSKTKTMFGSQLVSLAVKGYVTINVKEKDGMFGSAVYTITRNEEKDHKDSLTVLEEDFFASLFSSKGLLIITDKYNARVKLAYENMINKIDAAQAGKYVLRNNHLKGRQFILPVVFGVIGMIFYKFYGGNAMVTLIGFFLHMIFNVFYSKLYEQPTAEGRRLMDEIAGFEMYMKYADKLRIKAINPPSMDFTYFEKNLAYAIALDVAEEWKNQFDVKVIDQGTASHMPYLTGFSLGHLAAFSSQMSSAISSASTPPGSSSGSGGGGFSGGGGGGGGGGGW